MRTISRNWQWLLMGLVLIWAALGLAVSPAAALEAPPEAEAVTPAPMLLRAPAAPAGGNQVQSATLLQDWFGVNLQLTNTLGGGYNPWSFVLSSFAPTKRLETVDWVQADWYGPWNLSNTTAGPGVRGQVPSGGEWYDVEALYFDNDQDNIYIVVVTSFPFEGRDLLGNPIADGVGVKDSRATPAMWIRPGDLSLNLGLNGLVDGWRYDFGVDLVDEIRPTSGNITTMRSNTLGNRLYRTENAAWYLGHPNNSPAAQGELTNFDPVSSASLVTFKGEVTTNYYPLSFYNGVVEIKENGADTWVIEVTIPRSALAHTTRPNGPTDGDTIGIRWASSCRNDGNQTQGVISLTGVVQLGLTKSVSPAVFEEGTTPIPYIATYTFVVYNPKSTSLTNVTLVDNFSNFYFSQLGMYCLTAQSGAITRGGASTPFAPTIPLSLNLGTLSSGEAVTVTLVADVTGCGLGTWPNTAVADSDQTLPISDDASFIIRPRPSAVTLARFEALAQEQGILVEWETAMELDNLGFNLYRAETATGPWVQLNETLIPAINPGAVFGAVYTWNDAAVEPGAAYFYRLEDVDIEGLSTFHGPVQATALLVDPTAVSVTAFSAGGGAAWLLAVLGALTLLGGLERRRRR